MNPAAMLASFVAMGAQFWNERNVHPNPAPQIEVVNRPAGVEDAAGAYMGGNRIQISRSLVRQATREAGKHSSVRGYGGDSARAMLCATVFHEMGHQAGLDHTQSGLMSPGSFDAVPWPCQKWIRKQDRRK